MPRFKSIIENEKYGVGCTGQTVWVWDKNDTVIAKFKDLIYAYRAAFSPRGDIFVVKSAEAWLAVYSLETMSLIKKFRFSKAHYAQDDSFCFSPDGKYLLNVERYGDDLHSAIAVYNTSDFSLSSRLIVDECMMLSHIQQVGGEYYLLGFMRDSDGVISYGFVAKYKDDEICDIMKITNAEREFYNEHLDQTMFGLWLDDKMQIKRVHTLADLWSYYSPKQ